MVYSKSLKPKNERISDNSSSSWKSVLFGFFLFMSMVFCSIFYITQLNEMAVKGFEIKNIESQMAAEKAKNQDLNLKSTNLKTLSALSKSIDNLEMVKVVKMDYINGSGSTAMAR